MLNTELQEVETDNNEVGAHSNQRKTMLNTNYREWKRTTTKLTATKDKTMLNTEL